MQRSLIIALVGLALIALLEWHIDDEIKHYQTDQKANQDHSALLSGPVALSVKDGVAASWHWIHDNEKELLVIFTALLFVVTAYLVRYTKGLLVEARKQFPHFKRNVDAAKDAADAAKVSADAARREFISVHRPNLVVRKFQFKTETTTGHRGVEFVVTNIGRSKGVIVADSIDILFTSHNELLEIKTGSFPNYRHAQHLGKREYEPTERQAQWFIVADQKPNEIIDKVIAGELALVVYGYIYYQDALSGVQQTRFWLEYNRLSGRFERIKDDPDYDTGDHGG